MSWIVGARLAKFDFRLLYEYFAGYVRHVQAMFDYVLPVMGFRFLVSIFLSHLDKRQDLGKNTSWDHFQFHLMNSGGIELSESAVGRLVPGGWGKLDEGIKTMEAAFKSRLEEIPQANEIPSVHKYSEVWKKLGQMRKVKLSTGYLGGECVPEVQEVDKKDKVIELCPVIPRTDRAVAMRGMAATWVKLKFEFDNAQHLAAYARNKEDNLCAQMLAIALPWPECGNINILAAASQDEKVAVAHGLLQSA